MTANDSTPPTREPHTTKFRIDHRLWCFIAFALLGIVIFTLKEREVFPEASIDLRLSKADIAKLNRDWAIRSHFFKDKLIQSTTFEYDNNAKTYLEFELGNAQANELMKHTIPVWYWQTKLRKEFDEEQFGTCLSPTGELIYLNHVIQNEVPLPSLSHVQAKELALKFAKDDAKASLDGYEVVNDSTTDRQHRTDHSFTWEDKRTKYKDAYIRVSVTVSGNEVTSFYKYLYVPEEWQRKFATIRSYNETLGNIALVFYGLLHIAAAFILIWAITSRNARWRMGVILGVVAAIGAAFAAWNELPDAISAYGPTTTYRAFIGSYLLRSLGSCFATGLFASMLIIAGEAIYRMSYPNKMACEKFGEKKAFGTLHISEGLLVGLCLFCMSLGWVVTYYLMGTHIGYWCPQDVSNYEVLSAYAPAYSAVCLGVRASFTEEILFRVIGMGLARRVVGSFWLANFLQAISWGFAHSTYPQQPAYARGVELTLEGLLFGWIINRFGIVPCIVAHYLLDSFLTAQPLLESGRPEMILSGVLPIIPFPILAALCIARSSKRAESEEPFTNKHLDPIKTESLVEVPPHKPFAYKHLSMRVREILLVAMVISIIVGAFASNAPRVGTDFTLRVNREHALQKAEAILKEHGIRTDNWHVASTLYAPSLSSDELQYVYENVPLERTIELAKETQTPFWWQVRFYRPMQEEEYEVYIDGRGREAGFDVVKPEDAPGSRLTEQQARGVAETYITKNYPEWTPFIFESSSREERKNRTDWTLTYKVPKEKVGEADSKLQIRVVGDRSSNITQYWDVPDKWKFARQKEKKKDEIVGYVRNGAGVIFLGLVVWWAITLLRVGYFPFRPALIFGAAMALLYVPDWLNGLVDTMMSYQTTTPLSSFMVRQGMAFFETLMGRVGMFGLAMLIALPAARLLMPATNPLSVFSAVVAPDDAEERKRHRSLWLDAVLLSYFAVALTWSENSLSSWFLARFSPNIPTASLSGISAVLNNYVPSMALVVEAIARGMSNLLTIAVAAGLYAKYIKRFPIYLLFSIFCVLLMNAGDRYWQDFAIDSVFALANMLGLWAFVRYLSRDNVLFYVLFGIVSALFAHIPGMLKHAAPLLRAEAIAACVLMAVPAGYCVYLYTIGKKDTGHEPLVPPMDENEEPIPDTIPPEFDESASHDVPHESSHDVPHDSSHDVPHDSSHESSHESPHDSSHDSSGDLE